MITKKELKGFLEGKWDVTFEQIVKELKVDKREFNIIKKKLEELEEDGWIRKSFCGDHKIDEYDLGIKQGYH